MTDRLDPAWSLPTSKREHQLALPPTMADMGRRSQLWPRTGLDLPALLGQGLTPLMPLLKRVRSARRGAAEHDPADVLLPQGFSAEVVAAGLTGAVHVAFDDDGLAYVMESGHKTESPPRILRVDTASGAVEPFFEFRPDRATPTGALTGGTWHDGWLYVSNTDTVSRISRDGRIEDLVTDLPGRGDHQVNPPRVGPDGRLYFAVGCVTNSGVVGPDNATYGWLTGNAETHDVPAFDVTLSGWNAESHDVLGSQLETVRTGAFVPYGTETQPGQVVAGQVKSNALLRCDLDGSNLEVVAWGLRNPYGLEFHPDGRLFVTEHGMDARNRHVLADYDDFYEIVEGAWYGFPDFASGIRLDDPRWGEGGQGRERVLAVHPDPKPPAPFTTFQPHAAANGFAFSRDERFGFVGDAFVALFGDLAPVTTARIMTPAGFKVVRVDMAQRTVVDFAVNPVGGPASKLPHGGFERPSHCAFGPDGALYVVDFGEIDIAPEVGGIRVQQGSGALWRIRRTSPTIGDRPPEPRSLPFYALQLGAWLTIPIAAVGALVAALRRRRRG